MAKNQITQADDNILPCPFCGARPNTRHETEHNRLQIQCSNYSCGFDDWMFSDEWQQRHAPDLKQAYTQFEESLKAERKINSHYKEMEILPSKVARELDGGIFQEGTPLSARHAKSINEIIAMAKEYLNA